MNLDPLATRATSHRPHGFALRVVMGALLGAAVLGTPEVAHAGDTDIQWSDDWRRVQPWEVAGTFALLGTDLGIQLIAKTPSQPHFTGGILFDNWVRAHLRADTQPGQSRAQTISTSFFKGGTVFPFVVDDFLTALSIHENGDVAAQQMAIDLEAFSVAGLFAISGEKFAGRARPFYRDCGADGQARDAQGRSLHACDDSANESFFSGHSAAATTAAGLVCLHHGHLPLWGGGVADIIPCILMIGAAGATGVLRIVADDHWSSDVIIGWSVGVLSGYVLPSALHYGFGGHHPIPEIRTAGMTMVPTLLPYNAGAGLGMVGTF